MEARHPRAEAMFAWQYSGFRGPWVAQAGTSCLPGYLGHFCHAPLLTAAGTQKQEAFPRLCIFPNNTEV